MAVSGWASTVALSLLLAYSLAASAASLGSDTFVAPEPIAMIDTEGGSVSVWSSDFKLIEVSVSIFSPFLLCGLLAAPKYTDASQLSYVLEGHTAVGLITPFGILTNVRYLTKGDVLVTPAGWAFWAYNCGEKPFRIFGVADTSNGPRSGKYTAFHLVGGKANSTGGNLHSFSADVLAATWDVDEEVVEKLLSAQEKTAIIKVEKKVIGFIFMLLKEMGTLGTTRELVVEDGGCLFVVNSFKLPILKAVWLSVAHLKLEADAISAPGRTLHAAKIVDVIEETGRVEIAYPDGHKGLDTKVECGDVLIVPKLFLLTMVAGTEGLEVVKEKSILRSVTRNGKEQADVAITIRDYLKAEFDL
eukprot:SM000020S06051  [mRNA]  locus=s20:641881:644391:- [translate_table: standard]